MELHYIIATYAGIYRESENKEYVLQRQLQQIYKILKNKKKYNLPCFLRQITIVCPKVKNNHNTYSKYYQKNMWLYVFEREFPDIRLVYIDYIGQNQDHSYDQWIQGYLYASQYDYHLLMKDDYCISDEQSLFDQNLIMLYLKKFPNNIGYLATWAANNQNLPYHAAISNGVISKQTFEKFENPLKSYYDMEKVVNYPQLKFSYLFTNNGIPLADFTDKYQALFWHSENMCIFNFSSEHNQRMLIPVQITGLSTTKNSGKRTKIAFFLNQLSERGTEIAVYDYAVYNEILLNNESIFVVPTSYKQHSHFLTGLTYCDDVEKKFSSTFPLFVTDDLEKTLLDQKCDIFYVMKSGEIDKLISNTIPSIIHTVFVCTEEQKHGTVYSCVSEEINKCMAPVVPHICLDLPKLKPLLTFPDNSIVFGRYGGRESFDLEIAHKAISRAVKDKSNLYFVFMNTEKFIEHERVIFLPKHIDIETKAKFINSCDAMIHARGIGESFGLAIAEFTALEKPIITWKHDGPRNTSEDLHHINVLGNTGIYYKDENDLYNILVTFRKNLYKPPVNYTKIFTPEHVMSLFDKFMIHPCLSKKVKLKLLCNWTNTENLHSNWSKLIGNLDVTFVTENPDYWVILNKPPENAQYNSERTIVLGMEPDTFSGTRWRQWFENRNKFMYFMDEKYLNNIEWWISMNREKLLSYEPVKTKGNKLSAIVSGQYVCAGHILRINFLKEAENSLDIDIYGWENPFNFKKYIGPLTDKGDGLFPYKYTFAVENTIRPNYHTEKLIDGILAECLVFYWGSETVSNFFEENSYIMLNIHDIQGSIYKILNTIQNNGWERHIFVIRKMKKRILEFYSFVPRTLSLIDVYNLDKRTVNLLHRPEKWQKHLNECRRVQLHNVKHFSAIDGSKIDLNSDFIRNTFVFTANFVGPSKNTGAIVGCALSHYTLWNEVISNNRPMLIMEDDVIFENDFVERLGHMMKLLNTEPWDILFIGFHNHEVNLAIHKLPTTFLSDKFSKFDIINHTFMRKYGSESDSSGLHGGGTFGYLLSPSGANKLVNIVKKNRFYYPVDYQILYSFYEGLNIQVCPHRLLFSPKFGVDTYASDIQTIS